MAEEFVVLDVKIERVIIVNLLDSQADRAGYNITQEIKEALESKGIPTQYCEWDKKKSKRDFIDRLNGLEGTDPTLFHISGHGNFMGAGLGSYNELLMTYEKVSKYISLLREKRRELVVNCMACCLSYPLASFDCCDAIAASNLVVTENPLGQIKHAYKTLDKYDSMMRAIKNAAKGKYVYKVKNGSLQGTITEEARCQELKRMAKANTSLLPSVKKRCGEFELEKIFDFE